MTLGGDTSPPAGRPPCPSATEEATATVSGLTKEPGQAVRLTVRFARAEPLTFRTVIVPADRRLRVADAGALPHADAVVDA